MCVEQNWKDAALGAPPLDVYRAAIVRDRHSGPSLTKVAKKYTVSRATVCRLTNQAKATAAWQG
jgi:transposase